MSVCYESRSHERGSAILSTQQSVPLKELSDKFDWTKGLSDLYVSYVPDFGYQENISYTPRPQDKLSFWEDIAGLILTPYAPKYSRVLKKLNEKKNELELKQVEEINELKRKIVNSSRKYKFLKPHNEEALCRQIDSQLLQNVSSSNLKKEILVEALRVQNLEHNRNIERAITRIEDIKHSFEKLSLIHSKSEFSFNEFKDKISSPQGSRATFSPQLRKSSTNPRPLSAHTDFQRRNSSYTLRRNASEFSSPQTSPCSKASPKRGPSPEKSIYKIFRLPERALSENARECLLGYSSREVESAKKSQKPASQKNLRSYNLTGSQNKQARKVSITASLPFALISRVSSASSVTKHFMGVDKAKGMGSVSKMKKRYLQYRKKCIEDQQKTEKNVYLLKQKLALQTRKILSRQIYRATTEGQKRICLY